MYLESERTTESVPFQSLTETLNSEKFPDIKCHMCNGSGWTYIFNVEGEREYIPCFCF